MCIRDRRERERERERERDDMIMAMRGTYISELDDHQITIQCTCTHAHTHMHARTRAHTHTHTHTHTHMHTHTDELHAMGSDTADPDVTAKLDLRNITVQAFFKEKISESMTSVVPLCEQPLEFMFHFRNCLVW